MKRTGLLGPFLFFLTEPGFDSGNPDFADQEGYRYWPDGGDGWKSGCGTEIGVADGFAEKQVLTGKRADKGMARVVPDKIPSHRASSATTAG